MTEEIWSKAGDGSKSDIAALSSYSSDDDAERSRRREQRSAKRQVADHGQGTYLLDLNLNVNFKLELEHKLDGERWSREQLVRSGEPREVGHERPRIGGER